MSAGISIMDLAKRKQVTAKLGRMRKAQTFSVYPRKEGDTTIIVQSDKSIGEFDYLTGEGSLCTRGCYFVHLSLGVPFMFPQDFVREARAIWDERNKKGVSS